MITFTLSDKNSLLYVLVQNDPSTPLAKMGHDHVIRATSWKGYVQFDPDDWKQCKVSITLPVTGLRADEDHMRQHVGYPGLVSASDRKKTEENMLKKKQLHGAQFHQIVFTSTAIEPTPQFSSSGLVTVYGDMIIRGVSKSLTVTMQLQINEGQLDARGKFIVSHGDFGFQPFSAPLGTLRNKDEITFVVEVQASSE